MHTLVAVAGIAALLEGAVLAGQYSGRVADRYPDEWESDQFRVRRISLSPRAQKTEPESADTVIIFLTADLEGKMPPAEAVWQPAGARALENRGRARFDAIAVELKDVPAGAGGVTPPEAIPTSGRVAVWRLIDNPRVLVTKQRYAPTTFVDPLHFHPRDTLVVYLNAGYAWRPMDYMREGYAWWPSLQWSRAYRVTRGEADVVPANTFHTFGNAGFDPLEFVVIIPK